MNELKIMSIGGVDGYEKDGTVYLSLEAVARGLGFTQVKNGVEYVRWETVTAHLKSFGFPKNLGNCDTDFPTKLGKETFIPESIVYRLAMRAHNETAEAFQSKIAEEVVPAIRRSGYYSELPDSDLISAIIRSVEDPERRKSIVIAALQQADIRQEPFVAQLMGLERHERTVTLANKSEANYSGKKLIDWWRKNGERVYTMADIPERFSKVMFMMTGMARTLCKKMKNRGETTGFVLYCGEWYFTEYGYRRLIQALYRAGDITRETREWWLELQGFQKSA